SATRWLRRRERRPPVQSTAESRARLPRNWSVTAQRRRFLTGGGAAHGQSARQDVRVLQRAQPHRSLLACHHSFRAPRRPCCTTVAKVPENLQCPSRSADHTGCGFAESRIGAFAVSGWNQAESSRFRSHKMALGCALGVLSLRRCAAGDKLPTV